MMNSRDSFLSLVAGLRAGDNAAAQKLVDAYGPHVVRAIRRRIRSRKLQVLYNTDDCLQSVWGSVFADRLCLDGITSPNHLVKYLARVACNKLVDQDRHLRARRNDVYRERGLPGSQTADQWGLVATGPSPSQEVALEEEVQFRTRDLSSDQRTILELHRQGHSSDEIAAQTDYSGRGIRRILEQIRDLFRPMTDGRL